MHFYSNGVWTAAVGGSPYTSDHNNENRWTNSNDNDENTKFGDAGVPYEVIYDFGSPRFFDSYNWATANDQTPSRNPSRWIVYGSNDNSTWTVLADMSDWGQQGPTTLYTWAGVDSGEYTPVDNEDPDGGAANAYPLDTSIVLQPVSMDTSCVVGESGTLDLNGLNITVASLAASGTITNSTAVPVTLTLDQDEDSFFSGSVADNGANAISLVKSGTGTLSIFGSNAYSGSTVIESGTLKLGSGYRYYKFEVGTSYSDPNGLQYSEMSFYFKWKKSR